ncbi:MAG TPA: M42 family metallopeptidase [Chloroflexota bacterium]|nr:M42 family metallopeptidase [Chloroflexota bacterium]
MSRIVETLAGGNAVPAIDMEYIEQALCELCRIPSPTGFTDAAIAFVERELAGLGLASRRTVKGALVATLPGDHAGGARTLAAHVDTLGAMVAHIRENGRLRLTQIGSYPWNAIEGEYCVVHSAGGQEYSGTIMVSAASAHVHGSGTGKMERGADTMEVRLDARTTSAQRTRGLGIEVGDFVSLDPRTMVARDGFIKSRHLDDKAAVACLLGVVKALNGRRPAFTTHFFISNYEEVGHGAASGIPSETEELVAVDMAAIGEGYQTSDEFSVTICVKDGSGPYDHGLSNRLRALAGAHNIPYKVDIYRYYSSDASAGQRAGGAYRAALIGPGVDASHSFERTHRDALQATTALCLAYALETHAHGGEGACESR